MGIRVVIAEDDAQIAEIQRRFIERIDGFEVVGIAHALDEARDLVEVLVPDLLLLDVHFPGGNGLDLLRELRAAERGTDVVLITAAAEVATLQAALRGGVFDYILKPLVFDRMRSTLMNFAQHLDELHAASALDQGKLDDLLHRQPGGPGSGVTPEERLPKGIDPLTLDKVLDSLGGESGGRSAEAVGRQIGASRTTARRYLEFLVSRGEVVADVAYGTVGRPERRYQRC